MTERRSKPPPPPRVQLELDRHELCALLLLYTLRPDELSDVSRADLARARAQLEAALIEAAATRPTLPTPPPRKRSRAKAIRQIAPRGGG